jgi:hypothetical protein
MIDTAPLVQTLKSQADAVAAASDATTELGEVQFAGTVTRVAYIPSATITGANTDTRTINVINKGQSGAGTTVVATLALVSGVNATGSDAKALTLSGTPANLVVAQGDVLAFTSVHSGSTGLADPGGQVIVEVTRS